MKKNLQRLFLILLTICTVIYLVWRLGWTIPFDHSPVDIVCAMILLLTELIGIVEMGIHFFTQYDTNEYRLSVPQWNDGELPDVDVLVPTCGEPVELLKNTLTGCLAMKYDDSNKVHIWLCDDADNPNMETLAKELGVGYLRRKSHEDAKAGNLNAALKKTSAPLVAVFDADMCPKEDFLLKTVPYFLATRIVKKRRTLDPKFGYVQTPQAFRNADLFQRAFCAEEIIPNEQDYFYRNLEIHRNKSNSVIFGGSNTVLSRTALQSVGGFVTGTLTEDFATGIEIQKKGFTTYAIDEELAYGLAPESLATLIQQRVRWARGCIQSGRKTHFMKNSNLSAVQKANSLSAISYWYVPIKKLIYLLAPLLYAVGGITVMRCDFVQMLEFWLPMYVLSIWGIRLFSQKTRTAKWSTIYETCLFPFLLFPVLMESFGIRRKDFAVTDKSGKRGWRIWYPLPFLVLIAFSIWGIINVSQLSFEKQSFNYLFLLFWLCYNLYHMLFALHFVLACRKLGHEKENIGFVHDLRKDSALRTNLIFIYVRYIKRLIIKEGRER